MYLSLFLALFGSNPPFPEALSIEIGEGSPVEDYPNYTKFPGVRRYSEQKQSQNPSVVELPLEKKGPDGFSSNPQLLDASIYADLMYGPSSDDEEKSNI
jgi:hypothetical protein